MSALAPQLIDWPGIRAAAVAIGVREAARQAAADLPTDQQARFVQRVMKRSSREKWMVEEKRIVPASQTVSNVRTGSQALKSLLDANQNPKLLSLVEKREFLASAVRTPLRDIDERSPLAQKIRRRTDAEGNESSEVESVAKLRALELDARLAGELGDDQRPGGVQVLVNLALVSQ